MLSSKIKKYFGEKKEETCLLNIDNLTDLLYRTQLFVYTNDAKSISALGASNSKRLKFQADEASRIYEIIKYFTNKLRDGVEISPQERDILLLSIKKLNEMISGSLQEENERKIGAIQGVVNLEIKNFFGKPLQKIHDFVSFL